MNKKASQRGANGSAGANSGVNGRAECAEATPTRPNGGAHPVSSSDHDTAENGTLLKDIPPGEHPLPADVEEFIQEIHRKVDMTEVWHGLLRNPDDKIRQRAVERLTDLLYKGTATSGDEQQEIIFDMPRPKRD